MLVLACVLGFSACADRDRALDPANLRTAPAQKIRGAGHVEGILSEPLRAHPKEPRGKGGMSAPLRRPKAPTSTPAQTPAATVSGAAFAAALGRRARRLSVALAALLVALPLFADCNRSDIRTCDVHRPQFEMTQQQARDAWDVHQGDLITISWSSAPHLTLGNESQAVGLVVLGALAARDAGDVYVYDGHRLRFGGRIPSFRGMQDFGKHAKTIEAIVTATRNTIGVPPPDQEAKDPPPMPAQPERDTGHRPWWATLIEWALLSIVGTLCAAALIKTVQSILDNRFAMRHAAAFQAAQQQRTTEQQGAFQ